MAWLIKDSKGHILGPFSEEDICKKIKSQELKGEEWIATSPSVEWKRISSHPVFYQAFLEVSKNNNSKQEHSNNTHHHKTSDSITSTKTPSIKNQDFKKIKIKKQSSSVIEMSHIQSEFAKELKRKIILPIFIVGVLILCFLFLLPPPEQKNDEIKLIVPRMDQSQKTKEEIIERIKKGMIYYLHDQSSFYIKAQNEFVQAIEGDIKNRLAMSYLCLTYFELWPFSGKNSHDRQAISQLVTLSDALDQGGIYSALCRSIQYLIKEQYEQADSLIRTSIEEFSRNKNPGNVATFFYYLRGVVQNHKLKYESALKSLEHAQTLLPEWLKPYMLKADILKKQNELSKALKIYLAVLKINPNHKGATLNKSILEYKYLGKQNEAEMNIKKALHQPELVPASTLFEAYFVLTQIALKNNDQEQALKYGQQAYALNPSNKKLKEIISKISKEHPKTKIKSQQLIEQGDQLLREGRLLEAQSYYKIAFEVDKGKNSIAAKKMGQNLWKLGLVEEAIEWLKKSIIADPDLLESYILLSDYYSQIYDFDNASRILNTARKKSPNSVDIFKGYALLQFRRNHPENSIAYSKKALNLYESDVDSYILLSKSYNLIGELNESLKWASQAIEIDINSRPAQIQYAQILGHVMGVDTAFNYFNKLISHSQQHSQNHIDYTLALAQFLFDHQQYNQAQVAVQSLDQLKNKPIEYYLTLGRIASEKKDVEKAYELFITASSINPSNPLPLLNLGLLLTRTHQYSKARDYFKKILIFYSRYPKIHYYISRTLMLEGGKTNLETALKEAKIETQIHPHNPASFQLLGDIYNQLGKYTLCAQSFQKAIAILPENSELYVRVAICYRKAGDLDLALRILKSIAGEGKDRKKISNPKVFREMGALYELKKDYHNATNAYSIYLNMLPGAEDRKQIENRVKNFGQ